MLSLISTLIHVQRQVDATVVQQDHWLRDVAEQLPQFVWASDAHGRKTYCSHPYLDYTGAASVDAMDRLWKGFIHPDDKENATRRWNQSLSSGEPYGADYRLRRSDGVFRYFTAAALPVHDQAGEIVGWLGMSQDINEAKLAEQARELKGKLAAVSKLAASVAHEVNNALEGVTNALYLALQDDALAESTRHYLGIAEGELHRLARFTSHSLRFHKQSTAPVKASLSELVESVLSTYSPRLEAASIKVKREYRTGAKLLCCKDDFWQVFANLIQNSLDASAPEGRLLIRIRETHSFIDRGVRGIRVSVADSGEGVSPTAKNRVFEPFFSTRGATRTGLSLWITEKIVRRHHGRISYRSQTGSPKHWTVFSIFLPFDGILNAERLSENRNAHKARLN